MLHWLTLFILVKGSTATQLVTNHSLCSIDFPALSPEVVIRGWAKQKSESSGHFRNLVNYLFWHNSSIVQLVLSCRNCSLNRFCMLLCFGRVHVRMSCIIWNKCTEKRKSIPALPEFFANINSLNSEIWMSMTRIRILILISDICSCFMK